MRRWVWFSGSFLIALVAVSLLRTPGPTPGSRLLAAMDAARLPARRAILLVDYSPDDELVAAVRQHSLSGGEGNPPTFNMQGTPPPDQQWMQGTDFVFTWCPPGDSGELRQSLDTARDRLLSLLPTTRLNDLYPPAAIDAAHQNLLRLLDEPLLLAWMNADRGVLAEMRDPQRALEQAILLLARPGTDPILVFTLGRRHLYILPGERTRTNAWCELQAYDEDNSLLWTGTLRVSGDASAVHVRTLAAALSAAALRPATRRVEESPLTPKREPAPLAPRAFP